MRVDEMNGYEDRTGEILNLLLPVARVTGDDVASWKHGPSTRRALSIGAPLTLSGIAENRQ